MSKVCLIKSNEIVNGSGLFMYDDNIVSWNSDLELMEKGNLMFYDCAALTDFRAKTPRLSKAYCMFCGVTGGHSYPPDASQMPKVHIDLDNLVDGSEMFRSSYVLLCSSNQLSSTWELPKLQNGSSMFEVSSVFVSASDERHCDLGYMSFPSLINAERMFYGCVSVDQVTSYNDNFSATINFSQMFEGSSVSSVYLSNLVKWGDSYNDSASAYLAGSSGYKLAQNSGCDVAMHQMFRLCTNLDSVYLDVGGSPYSSDFRIDATMMFERSMRSSSSPCIQLCTDFANKLKNCERMFYNCSATYVYEELASIGSSLNLPYVTHANAMFANSKLQGKLYLSLPSVEDTTYLVSGASYVTEVDIHANKFCGSEFSYCYYLENANLTIMGTEDVSFQNTFANSHKLQSVTINAIEHVDAVNCYGMFEGCGYLTSAEIADSVDLYLSVASNMFRNCFEITDESVSNFTSKFYDFKLREVNSMFAGCKSITEMPVTLKQVKFAQNTSDMFYDCTSLQCRIDEVWPGGDYNGEYKFNYLTNASGMFRYSGVGGRWYYEMPNVTDCTSMFGGTGVKFFGYPFNPSDKVLHLGNLTNAFQMFTDATQLSECHISMPNVQNAGWMFYNCGSLSKVADLYMPELHKSASMFKNCSALSSITLDSVYNMDVCYEMFAGCANLRTITLKSRDGGNGWCNWNWTSHMFATDGDLTITTDSNAHYEILQSASDATGMFAGYKQPDYNLKPHQYPKLKLSGSLAPHAQAMTHVADMFNCRTIEDSATAMFIGMVSFYNDIASSQSLGSIYLTDSSYIDSLNCAGDWTRSQAFEVSEYSYVRYELTKEKSSGVTLSLTVYCDEYVESTPYDIVEGSPYIPDASSWKSDFEDSGIMNQVTSIRDGWAWNDNI